MPKQSKSCHCHPREIRHDQDVIPSAAKPGKSSAFKLVTKRKALNSRQPKSAVTVTYGKARKPLTLAQRRARAADRNYSAVLLGTR